jgi:hypothetical protein
MRELHIRLDLPKPKGEKAGEAKPGDAKA